MQKILPIWLSLLTVGAAFLALAPGAAADHAPTANADRTTIYEAESRRQYVSTNFTGSYSTDPGETVVTVTWVFGDGTQASGFVPPAKSFTDGGTYGVRMDVLVEKNGAFTTKSRAVTVNVVNPAPTWTHNPPSITANQPLKLEFHFADNQGINTATLFYRIQGTTSFISKSMTIEGTRDAATQIGKWVYSIPAVELTGPVEYYVRATDKSANNPQTVEARPAAGQLYTASGGAGDTAPPTITLDLSGTKVTSWGASFAALVGLSDPSGVQSATFGWKKVGNTTWTTAGINVTTKAIAIPWWPNVGGTYNWYVQAVDARGNTGNLHTQASPGTFTLAVGPKINLNALTGVQKLAPGGQIAVTGTVLDDKAGTEVLVRYNAGDGWTTASHTLGTPTGTGPYTYSLSFNIPMPAGEFGARTIRYYVNATDAPEANVVSSGLLSVVVSTDVTKPTISGEYPAGPVKAVAAIGAALGDAGGSGLDPESATLAIDSTVVPAAQLTRNATAIRLGAGATLTALTEGSHTVMVTVKDNHGNEQSKTWTFHLDKTAPTISGGTTGFVKVGEVEATVTDSGAGVQGVSATIDGAAATSDLHDGGKVHVKKTGLTDGVHAVVLTVSDRAGNSATKAWNFTLDTIAPTVTVSGVDGSLTTGKPAIAVTLADAGSGVKAASVALKIDGVAQAVTATATGFTFTPTADLADGSHTVELTVEDNAGNKVTSSKTFTVALPKAAAEKKGFFGLPGFELVAVLAGLAAAMLVLRRRA